MDAHDYAIEHDHVLVIRGLAESCLRVVRICDRRNELIDLGEFFHSAWRDLTP